jgi:hypothetical protein
MNSLPSINDEIFRFRERSRGPAYVCRVGPVARGDHRLVNEWLWYIFGKKIEWNFYERRTSSPIPKIRKSPTEDVRNFGRGGNRLCGLGHRAHTSNRIEIRIHMRQSPCVAHWEYKDRNGFAVCLRDAAKGIFRSRSVLHRKNADLASTREARNGVGHVKPDAFLANNYRPYAGACRGLENVIYRISEDNVNALAF